LQAAPSFFSSLGLVITKVNLCEIAATVTHGQEREVDGLAHGQDDLILKDAFFPIPKFWTKVSFFIEYAGALHQIEPCLPISLYTPRQTYSINSIK